MSDKKELFPVGHHCAGIVPPNRPCDFRRPNVMFDNEGKKIKIVGVSNKLLNLIKESGSKDFEHIKLMNMLCNACYQKIKKMLESNPTIKRKKILYERIEGYLTKTNDKKIESIEQIVSDVFNVKVQVKNEYDLEALEESDEQMEEDDDYDLEVTDNEELDGEEEEMEDEEEDSEDENDNIIDIEKENEKLNSFIVKTKYDQPEKKIIRTVIDKYVEQSHQISAERKEIIKKLL